MRKLLRAADTVLPIIGVFVVLAAVLFVIQLRFQLALVVLGLLLVQVGVWNAASQMVPNERKYLALRREVDHFVNLVRVLNGAALALRREETVEARQEFERVRVALHDAVENIAAVAGKTEREVALERSSQPWSWS